MRSTLYCHCMEGYTCPYLELVYQYTTFKTEQSWCQQTVTTSIYSKVCDMMGNSSPTPRFAGLGRENRVKLSCSTMVMRITINNTSPTGQLWYPQVNKIWPQLPNGRKVSFTQTFRRRENDFPMISSAVNAPLFFRGLWAAALLHECYRHQKQYIQKGLKQRGIAVGKVFFHPKSYF